MDKTQLHPAVRHLMYLLEMPPRDDADAPLFAGFLVLARNIASRPNSPETSVALRLLVDARDAAIRRCSWSAG